MLQRKHSETNLTMNLQMITTEYLIDVTQAQMFIDKFLFNSSMLIPVSFHVSLLYDSWRSLRKAHALDFTLLERFEIILVHKSTKYITRILSFLFLFLKYLL